MGLICPLGTCCPLGCFVPWEFLCLERFCLWDVLSLENLAAVQNQHFFILYYYTIYRSESNAVKIWINLPYTDLTLSFTFFNFFLRIRICDTVTMLTKLLCHPLYLLVGHWWPTTARYSYSLCTTARYSTARYSYSRYSQKKNWNIMFAVFWPNIPIPDIYSTFINN